MAKAIQPVDFGRPWQILKTVFGISAGVNRPIYNLVGFGLMALKYSAEAALIWRTTGTFFDPLSFVIPSYSLRDFYFQLAPPWVPWVIFVWSIPFVWIAISMSVRRAIDAGKNPLTGILVVIPIFNLLVMLILAMAPSAERDDLPPDDFEKHLQYDRKQFVFSAVLGVLIGGLFSLVVTIVSANLMHNYGQSLFMGMPVVAGATAGFAYNQPFTKGIAASVCVGGLAVCLGGLGLLLFALEGVICLAMALPMIAPLGMLGGALGWFLSKVIILQSKWMLGGAALLLVPVLGVLEMATKQYETLMVESSIVIQAQREQVWENVVAFPDIDSPEPWYFQLGVAMPIRARIEGQGVGAVRHCEFTTGSFVEPITVWDRPNRLAFDVVEQPDPMIELTPYRNVRPPHLSHSFYSVQGEFELVDNGDGSTTLIGRTWYSVEMGPQFYWKLWTDEIIHRIHMRVLEHIANVSTRTK